MILDGRDDSRVGRKNIGKIILQEKRGVILGEKGYWGLILQKGDILFERRVLHREKLY